MAFAPIEIRQDESGHTYYIPSVLNDEFNAWMNIDEECFGFDPNHFDKFRVKGDAPQVYVDADWIELKMT